MKKNRSILLEKGMALKKMDERKVKQSAFLLVRMFGQKARVGRMWFEG